MTQRYRHPRGVPANTCVAIKVDRAGARRNARGRIPRNPTTKTGAIRYGMSRLCSELYRGPVCLARGHP